MRNKPAVFFLVPDCFITQEMYIKAVEVDPWQLKDVPDHLTTQEMCDKAVRKCSSLLMHVPDWFVTRELVYMWYDDIEYCDDNDEDNFFTLDHDYQKRKAEKASVKEELLPITWHPSRWYDWCVPEDEKKETEKLFLTI